MHRTVRTGQTKVQLHMRDWVCWKILWEEKSYILQAATTRSKEAEKFYCIHLVWSRKQVFLPNFLWFHFWKWIRLDSARVLQLRQQQPFQDTAILQRSPCESELLQVEQVSPVTADNEVNTEPFYARPSNLQLQHWWTGNYGLLKSQDNRTQDPAAERWSMCNNGIYQYQRLWGLQPLCLDDSKTPRWAPSHWFTQRREILCVRWS